MTWTKFSARTPPWFAFTFLNASTTACFGIANGFSVDFG
jgi:hypothetical protein